MATTGLSTNLVIENSIIPCTVSVYSNWDVKYTEALSLNLTLAGTWNPSAYNPLLTFHLLSGGEGPCMRLMAGSSCDDSSLGAFRELHRNCHTEQKALTVQLHSGQPIFLVPVQSTEGDALVETWWGYQATIRMVDLTLQLLTNSRLAVIFDLDETLVCGNSSHTLETKLEALRRQRRALTRDLQENAAIAQPVRDRERQQQQAALLEHEEALMAGDLALLKQYASQDAVTYNGQTLAAVAEPVQDAQGNVTMTRPIIRIPSTGGDIVLTRIDPARRDTSMVLRLRPGWENLRAHLAGVADNKQRFEIYVCTAAEREYALEVWRLFDTAATLIPPGLRGARVKCIPSLRKKSIDEVLSLHIAQNPGAAGALQPVPVAVVIDDRTEVWDESDQSAIMKVLPFFPYKDEALRLLWANSIAAANAASELYRVQEVVTRLRSDVYFCVNMVLKKYIEAAHRRGFDEALQQQLSLGTLLPAVNTVPKILQGKAAELPFRTPPFPSVSSEEWEALLQPATPQPVVPPAALPQAPQPAPAAVQNTPAAVASLVPVDPRKAKKTNTQAAPTARSTAQAGGPRDPRQRAGAAPRLPFSPQVDASFEPRPGESLGSTPLGQLGSTPLGQLAQSAGGTTAPALGSTPLGQLGGAPLGQLAGSDAAPKRKVVFGGGILEVRKRQHAGAADGAAPSDHCKRVRFEGDPENETGMKVDAPHVKDASKQAQELPSAGSLPQQTAAAQPTAQHTATSAGKPQPSFPPPPPLPQPPQASTSAGGEGPPDPRSTKPAQAAATPGPNTAPVAMDTDTSPLDSHPPAPAGPSPSPMDTSGPGQQSSTGVGKPAQHGAADGDGPTAGPGGRQRPDPHAGPPPSNDPSQLPPQAALIHPSSPQGPPPGPPFLNGPPSQPGPLPGPPLDNSRAGPPPQPGPLQPPAQQGPFPGPPPQHRPPAPLPPPGPPPQPVPSQGVSFQPQFPMPAEAPRAPYHISSSGTPPQQKPVQGQAPQPHQSGPPQGIPPPSQHNGSDMPRAPYQITSQGPPPQHGQLQLQAHQQGPPQMAPQGAPLHLGPPSQHGPPDGYNPHGLPPQLAPPHQQGPSMGHPNQPAPPPGHPPPGHPSQQGPPQGHPNQPGPPQPPQAPPMLGHPSQGGLPQMLNPQPGPPSGQQPYPGPPPQGPHQAGPPQHPQIMHQMHPQNMPPGPFDQQPPPQLMQQHQPQQFMSMQQPAQPQQHLGNLPPPPQHGHPHHQQQHNMGNGPPPPQPMDRQPQPPHMPPPHMQQPQMQQPQMQQPQMHQQDMLGFLLQMQSGPQPPGYDSQQGQGRSPARLPPQSFDASHPGQGLPGPPGHDQAPWRPQLGGPDLNQPPLLQQQPSWPPQGQPANLQPPQHLQHAHGQPPNPQLQQHVQHAQAPYAHRQPVLMVDLTGLPSSSDYDGGGWGGRGGPPGRGRAAAGRHHADPQAAPAFMHPRAAAAAAGRGAVGRHAASRGRTGGPVRGFDLAGLAAQPRSPLPHQPQVSGRQSKLQPLTMEAAATLPPLPPALADTHPISLINECAQKNRGAVLYTESQLTHNGEDGWMVDVLWNKQLVASGWHKGKKEAKKLAATAAFRNLLADGRLTEGIPGIDDPHQPSALAKKSEKRRQREDGEVPAPPSPLTTLVNRANALTTLYALYPNAVAYTDVNQTGPAHLSTFQVQLIVQLPDKQLVAAGSGLSKKEAKKVAALEVLTRLGFRAAPEVAPAAGLLHANARLSADGQGPSSSHHLAGSLLNSPSPLARHSDTDSAMARPRGHPHRFRRSSDTADLPAGQRQGTGSRVANQGSHQRPSGDGSESEEGEISDG